MHTCILFQGALYLTNNENSFVTNILSLLILSPIN